MRFSLRGIDTTLSGVIMGDKGVSTEVLTVSLQCVTDELMRMRKAYVDICHEAERLRDRTWASYNVLINSGQLDDEMKKACESWRDYVRDLEGRFT